ASLNTGACRLHRRPPAGADQQAHEAIRSLPRTATRGERRTSAAGNQVRQSGSGPGRERSFDRASTTTDGLRFDLARIGYRNLKASMYLCALLAALAEPVVAHGNAGPGKVEISVLDQATGKPLPCRIHLKDTGGKAQRAGKLPFWRDHFVCPGT